MTDSTNRFDEGPDSVDPWAAVLERYRQPRFSDGAKRNLEITKYATHDTMLALTDVIEKLQHELRVAVMAINSQAHKIDELTSKVEELQHAAGGAMSRMDFFLGAALITNGGREDLSSGELEKLIAEDVVALNQISLEFGR